MGLILLFIAINEKPNKLATLTLEIGYLCFHVAFLPAAAPVENI